MLQAKVTIEGGVIQGIEVPEGVEVVVYDYDAEGFESDRLQQDDKGEDCSISVWRHEGQARSTRFVVPTRSEKDD